MNEQIISNDCPAVTKYIENKRLAKSRNIKRSAKLLTIAAATALTVTLLLSDNVYCYAKTHMDLGLFPGQHLAAQMNTNNSKDYTQAEFDEALSFMESELADKYYLISADYYGTAPKTGSDEYSVTEGNSMAFMINIYPDYSGSGYDRDADYPGLYKLEYQMWLVRDSENDDWHVGYFGNGI